MLLHIPDILSAEEVAHCRRMLDAAGWIDGNVTALGVAVMPFISPR